MYVQKTNWGYINWINLDKLQKNDVGMNVGLVTLYPKAHQQVHTHYDSQMVYILEGRGFCYINGEKFEIYPERLFVWPVGVEHEIYNTGDTELKHLLVSQPVNIEDNKANFIQHKTNLENVSENILHIAIEAIRTQFLETLNYNYSIYYSNNRLINRSSYMPEYCHKNCKFSIQGLDNPCIENLSVDLTNEYDFNCKYNVRIISIPIVYNGKFLGYIQGGYFYEEYYEDKYYVYPESSIEGIRNLLRRIVKAIVNYCEFSDYNKELEKRDFILAKREESQRILLDKMKRTNSKILDMKINNHFLFNTLNSMASMAIESDQWALYNSIINLSKMFKYNQKRNFNFVKLKEEIEYINSYLELQKNRYGEYLEILYDIDSDLLNLKVPFNFLQPIVENAFEYMKNKNKKIKININQGNKNYNITILNNDSRLSQLDVEKINNGIKSGTSHGLAMVYHKLKNAYGNNFKMQIKRINNYTKVEICLPIIMEKDKMDD